MVPIVPIQPLSHKINHLLLLLLLLLFVVFLPAAWSIHCINPKSVKCWTLFEISLLGSCLKLSWIGTPLIIRYIRRPIPQTSQCSPTSQSQSSLHIYKCITPETALPTAITTCAATLRTPLKSMTKSAQRTIRLIASRSYNEFSWDLVNFYGQQLQISKTLDWEKTYQERHLLGTFSGRHNEYDRPGTHALCYGIRTRREGNQNWPVLLFRGWKRPRRGKCRNSA